VLIIVESFISPVAVVTKEVVLEVLEVVLEVV